MIRLGVNVDHVATVRQARRERWPDPTAFAHIAIKNGADGITAHLREDRRHIQDEDVSQLNRLPVPFNLEMAVEPSIVSFAVSLRPTWVCLVPERREELTTEGGLDIRARSADVKMAVDRLRKVGVKVSLFLEADPDLMSLAFDLGAHAVELHTGAYARAFRMAGDPNDCCSGEKLSFRSAVDHEISKLLSAAKLAREKGLIVNAGHGLDYVNIEPIARAFSFNEFNIGFAIVTRSLETGFGPAVAEMKKRMDLIVCAES